MEGRKSDRRQPRKLVHLPLTKKDFQLEQQIMKEYECPVCFNLIKPPIMMCINNHVICYPCWTKCFTCPTCRINRTFTRALILERIHQFLNFPCRWEGCSIQGTSSFISQHELKCQYFPINCPLSDCYPCSWKGTIGTLTAHMKSFHTANIFLTGKVILRSRNFGISKRKDYTIVFSVNGRLFKLTWHYNLDVNPRVHFGTIAIGNGEPNTQYYCSMIFSKKFPINSGCRKLKIVNTRIERSNSDCSIADRPIMVSFQRTVNHSHFYEELRQFCDDDHNLIYQVIIEPSVQGMYSKFVL